MSLLALLRDPWSAPFFDAAARGQLLLLKCDDCQQWSAPQARRCAVCSSERVEWVDSAGIGEIVTWAIPHRRESGTTTPAYVVAIVQLEEGPWIHVHGSPELALRAGQQVSVTFSPVLGGEPLPVLVVGA